eukprot:gene11233-13071_t
MRRHARRRAPGDDDTAPPLATTYGTHGDTWHRDTTAQRDTKTQEGAADVAPRHTTAYGTETHDGIWHRDTRRHMAPRHTTKTQRRGGALHEDASG